MARRERQVVVQTVLDSAGSTTVPVLFTNGVVYTKTFRIDDAVTAAVSVVSGLVAATGSAKITAVIEQGYEPPNVEGSAHPSYITTDTIMNTFATVGTHTHNAISLRGFRYARVKLTPATPNTSAYVAVTLTKQVEG